MNVLSDGYVSGIVAHLSKDELARYDAELGAVHPELGAAPQLEIGASGSSNQKDERSSAFPPTFN